MTAPTIDARLTAWRPVAHAALRVAAGLLFIQHGFQKLFGAFGGLDGAGATADLGTQIGLAGMLEFGGGLLLITGFLVRPVAAILLLEMLVAYFTAHFPQGGWPLANGGELALLFGTIFLFLSVAGAGPYSVDDWLRKRRGEVRR